MARLGTKHHRLQRARQARYEARQRDGIKLASVPLGPAEIAALVKLRWLPARAKDDRERISAAAAAALRSLLD
jgi:hypothetical protein